MKKGAFKSAPFAHTTILDSRQLSECMSSLPPALLLGRSAGHRHCEQFRSASVKMIGKRLARFQTQTPEAQVSATSV